MRGRWIAAAGTVLLTIAAAPPVDLPARKPGLWDLTITPDASARPPMAVKLCLDAKADAELIRHGMEMKDSMCSRNDIKRSGNIVTIDSECQVGQSRMTSHGTVTYTGDTAFELVLKSHYDPPMMNRTEGGMKQSGTWVGACPTGMQPGEIIMPGGQKMNLLDRLK